MLAKFSAALTLANFSTHSIKGISFVPDWWSSPIRSPYIFLILGVISISAAVVFTCTGKVWVRFNGWVYRAKEPGWFWWDVAIDYLIGVFFVGYFLYKVYGPPN
jgi:hypothetical protein